MATVIVGGGIIGLSTAYYLSRTTSASKRANITVVDTAPRLLAGASGFAGGFLAPDWFSPAVAPLGQLSFDLHEKLAAEEGGRDRWSYGRSTALSLSVADLGVSKPDRRKDRTEDWLLDDSSRKEAATVVDQNGHDEEPEDVLNKDGSPRWIKSQPGGSMDPISSPGGCAQVEPWKLCDFLRNESEKKGVRFLLNTRAVQAEKISDGMSAIVKLQNIDSGESEEIAADNIVVTAGPWTADAFHDLFPDSKLRIPIESLAGHSCTIRSRHLQHYPTPLTSAVENKADPFEHAIFSGPAPQWQTFAPEAISRMGRDGVAEIFVAGLNSQTMPLPRLATDSVIDEKSRAELRKVTRILTGEEELNIVREAVCFRPVVTSGISPIVGNVGKRHVRGGCPKVIIASGHGPWGISLSLGTGLIASELVLDKKTTVDVSALGRVLR